MNTRDMRREYSQRGLAEADLASDPIAQFTAWFDTAHESGLIEPNVMILATCDRDGRPSARAVLLKGFDERGFVFYSNYESRKGHELATHPFAALVFYWDVLERQVRIEGRVERVSAEESDHYFAARPRGSQLGAAASPQSQIVPSREALEERLAQLETAYAGRDVPRPASWGGYCVVPEAIEFWQGRPNRLHDRLRYRRQDGGPWTIERLAP